MSAGGPLSERAILLAPRGRDAQVAAQILKEVGIPGTISPHLGELCAQLWRGAALAIVADEAILDADLRSLVNFLDSQAPWSDLPIVVLTHRGGGPERNPAAARLAGTLGNVTFLERPFHPTTMASIVRAALRARKRQYEARTRLEELAESERRLQQRVEERTAELKAEAAIRERAQEQLRQAQKMESIGQLTGGIAHDFNNLLMAVMTNLELLGKRVMNDPQALRQIDSAYQGAQRGASLTQRLLAFARQQDLRVASTDMGKLLREMGDLLDRSLGPQVTLEIGIANNLPPALVDANQVELAILNLAINARDAMADGGTIVIALSEEEIADGRELSPGPYLRISISDTGTGMDEATLKRAIEPFFSTKPLGKGTGLGLSMVHGLAVQLGGLFELSSVVGKGTVASLWLPAATAPPLAVETPMAPPMATQPVTILVVDDDWLIAMSTVEMLEDLGHTVIDANSGKRALEILQSGAAIDLMMTDHAMPGMTGSELAVAARRLRPDLPILMATGYADLPPGEMLDLPRLSKPFQQAQVQAEIARLLPNR